MEMEVYVVEFSQDGTEKVRLLEAESREAVRDRFTMSDYSHLNLISIYEYDQYRKRTEELVKNAQGTVRFGEVAFESLPTEGDK